MANNGGAPPVGHEGINTDIVTLTRFFTEEQVKAPEATGDFTYVFLFSVPLIIPNYSNAVLLDQSPLPRSSVLFQVHCLLHPTGLPD